MSANWRAAWFFGHLLFLWCTHFNFRVRHWTLTQKDWWKDKISLHIGGSIMSRDFQEYLCWHEYRCPPPFHLSQCCPVFPAVLFPSLLSGFPGHLWVLQYATLMRQHYLHTTCLYTSLHCVSVSVSERVSILGLTASGSQTHSRSGCVILCWLQSFSVDAALDQMETGTNHVSSCPFVLFTE